MSTCNYLCRKPEDISTQGHDYIIAGEIADTTSPGPVTTQTSVGWMWERLQKLLLQAKVSAKMFHFPGRLLCAKTCGILFKNSFEKTTIILTNAYNAKELHDCLVILLRKC